MESLQKWHCWVSVKPELLTDEQKRGHRFEEFDKGVLEMETYVHLTESERVEAAIRETFGDLVIALTYKEMLT